MSSSEMASGVVRLDEEDCGLLMAALGLWRDECRERLRPSDIARIERLDGLLGSEVFIMVSER